jgi:hypothetical protein
MVSHARRSRPAIQRDHALQRARTPRPEDDLLDLQRLAGNEAVANLVQRAPRDRPASTDAPGARRKKPPAKEKGPPAKTAEDIRARVVKYEVVKGEGLIGIASGTDQGVKVGMTGSLIAANDTESADFVIERVAGGISYARIRATQDQVNSNPYVVIKASQFEDVNLGDKEF